MGFSPGLHKPAGLISNKGSGFIRPAPCGTAPQFTLMDPLTGPGTYPMPLREKGQKEAAGGGGG